MNRTIWKFPIELTFEMQLIELPKPARILSAGVQGNDIVIWAVVDPEAEPQNRLVQVVPTGGRVPADATFLNTVFMGAFVFHVFEVKP